MTAKSIAGTRRLTLCALMAAVACVLAPISIPIGPISVTGGTLAVYLTAYLLGGVWGTVSTLVYLLVGMAGLPVFSGYMGGVSRLAGPTGGYLVGYIPMALLAGTMIRWSAHRFDGKGRLGAVLTLAVQFAGTAAATAVLYAFGTAWYCVQAGVDLQKALAACVIPFIPFDLVKMAVALTVGRPVRRRLERAGLLDTFS